jgi:hypothetical protein
MAPRSRKIKTTWEADHAGRDEHRVCSVTGKRVYANEREAKATANHRMADKETGPDQLRTYKSLYCGGWHLTSQEA